MIQIKQLTNITALLYLLLANCQISYAGDLEPSTSTVAPTMVSLQQIYDQQQLAHLVSGSLIAGPGLITSSSPTGSGDFLGPMVISSLVITVRNLGDCDVTIDSFSSSSTVSVTIPAYQSYARASFFNNGHTKVSYTFLGGTDCRFMWSLSK